MDSENDLQSSLGMFQAAMHARPVALSEPVVENIVLVLDGSNQDASARHLANELAAAWNAQVHECSAATAAEILQHCESRRAGLLVIPVPFGRDIAVLKEESLGSVADIVLQEAKRPVLCVRQPLDNASLSAARADVLVPVLDHAADHARAAGWALKAVAGGGTIELLGVADRDLLEEARQLLGDAISADVLRADALDRSVKDDVGGLVAAVQKRGLELNLNIHVEVKVGRAIEVVLPEANARPRLTVVAGSPDHTSVAYHHAADVVLGAAGPVLVV